MSLMSVLIYVIIRIRSIDIVRVVTLSTTMVDVCEGGVVMEYTGKSLYKGRKIGTEPFAVTYYNAFFLASLFFSLLCFIDTLRCNSSIVGVPETRLEASLAPPSFVGVELLAIKLCILYLLKCEPIIRSHYSCKKHHPWHLIHKHVPSRMVPVFPC